MRNADISIDDDQQDDLDLKSKDYRKDKHNNRYIQSLPEKLGQNRGGKTGETV